MLKRHIFSKHQVEKHVPCPYCDQLFLYVRDNIFVWFHEKKIFLVDPILLFFRIVTWKPILIVLIKGLNLFSITAKFATRDTWRNTGMYLKKYLHIYIYILSTVSLQILFYYIFFLILSVQKCKQKHREKEREKTRTKDSNLPYEKCEIGSNWKCKFCSVELMLIKMKKVRLITNYENI